MPPEELEKAPEQNSFESGLLSNGRISEELEGNALITRNRSFMDKGEAVFTQEQQDEREQAAEGARLTLLARMKSENEQSVADATDMQQKHADHKQRQMDEAINYAREKKKESHLKAARYYVAQSYTGRDKAIQARQNFINYRATVREPDDQTTNAFNNAADEIQRMADNPNSWLWRKFSWAGTTANRRKSDFEESKNEARTAARKIVSLSNSWDSYLEEYKQGTYKVRSRNYDRLFQRYYMLSRGKQMDAEGEGQNFKKQGDDGANAENTNAKDIAEYIGKYENPAELARTAYNFPYRNLSSVIVVGRQLNDGSRNRLQNQIKFHTMVTMEAFGQDSNGNQVTNLYGEQAGPEPVRRVRIKIDNKFMGYKARNQIDAQGNLAADANFAGSGDEQKSAMSNLHLVVDEKGANNEFLFSQKSAKLYTAKNKNTGRTTKGFFIDGEFVSADKNVMKSQEEASYWGSPNFKKVASGERLRNAIRRSDFFHHINSGTIQYYMNYDEDHQNVADKGVERDFMARRASIFSLTTLGQSLIDGTLISNVGGTFGAVVGDNKALGIPKDAINGVYGKYAAMLGKMLKFNRKYKIKDDKKMDMGAVGPVIAAVTPAAAIVGGAGAAVTGAGISIFLGTLLTMADNVFKIIDTVKKWKDEKEGASKASLFADGLEAIISLASSVTNIIDTIADKLWSDQLKSFTSIAKSVFTIIKDVVVIFASGFEKSRITSSDKALETALQAFATRNDVNARGQYTDEQRQEGVALSNNAQSKYFLTMARNRASRDQAKSVFEFLSNGADAVGNFLGVGEKSSWFNPISLPFKLAGKVFSFMGTGVDKFMGWLNRRDNVGAMLGDNSLDSTPNFDGILKEETGIKSKHYLSGLMRVFMAIDTHCLLHKSFASGNQGEIALALDTVKPYYQKGDTETAADFLGRVRFNRLMLKVGAPNNWRSMLLESIS